MTDDNQELDREADHLYRCLLGGNPPPDLVAGYVDAHRTLPDLRTFPPDQRETMRVVTARRLDAAAIEPWLRRRGRRHALSAKLLLIAYLSEAGNVENGTGFLRTGVPGRGVLIVGLMQGALALIRGFYLTRRHGLL